MRVTLHAVELALRKSTNEWGYHEVPKHLEKCWSGHCLNSPGWWGKGAGRERGPNQRGPVSPPAIGTLCHLQRTKRIATFDSRGRKHSFSEDGWFRRFVYRFVCMASRNKADSRAARCLDAEPVYQCGRRTEFLAATNGSHRSRAHGIQL